MIRCLPHFSTLSTSLDVWGLTISGKLDDRLFLRRNQNLLILIHQTDSKGRIDSVSIIQDDLEDWREQSAQMAIIYENAFVTLCASEARDDDEGFYSNWEPTTKQNIRVGKRDGTEYQINVETGVEERHHRHFPLENRAWAYQERFLSPRLIHFKANEMTWDCATLQTCECFFLEEDLGCLIEPSPVLYRSAVLYGETQPRMWHQIVYQYSRLDLTLEKDKLPAVSGIAKHILKSRPKEDYLAGLWRSSLLSDLCWSMESSQRPVVRPPIWRSPSWSWASLDGNVRFEIVYPNDINVCTCVDASVTLAGVDPTGEVTSGYIILSAPAMLGRLQHAPLSSGSRRPAYIISGAPYDDTSFTSLLMLDVESDVEDGSLQIGDDLLCLAIRKPVYHWYDDWIFCLVLKKCEEGEATVYKRVGCMCPDPAKLQTWFAEGPGEMVVKII